LKTDRWTSVRVRTPTDRAAVISALFEIGAEGVQELDDEIITHFHDADEARITSALSRADSRARVEYAPTPSVDWSSQWRSRIAAHRVGRLVVSPPWLADQFTESERIVIEPEMAFGTGEHETTRGMLRLMQQVVSSGDVVADLGAGSAVLAIAAAKLGARRVVAIEIDADAIGNAERNVLANTVGDRVSVVEGDAFSLLPLLAPIRVALANIVSSVLKELLLTIGRALTSDGAAILSGILVDEKTDMESALRADGWHIVDAYEEGIWWTVTVARP